MVRIPARLLVDRGAVDVFWSAVAGLPGNFGDDLTSSVMGGGGVTGDYERLAGLLRAVHPGLVLEVGLQPGGRCELVVSAGGLRNAIGAAFAVVDAAPQVVRDRFEVKALRPRLPLAAWHAVVTESGRLAPTQVRWSAIADRRVPDACHLDLHVRGWDEFGPADCPGNMALAEQVYLLLDHLLGEYSTAMQITDIGWHSLAGAEQLPDISTLAQYVDGLANA